ncbi:MAG: hypothetical protein AAF821_07450 [Cyanobacteria bacterium P01_D01_bin.156]
MEFDFEDVLAYVNDCVQSYGERPLTDAEQAILRWTWEGLSYSEMARRMAQSSIVYSPKTLHREIGFKLWRFLGKVWPEEDKVTKPKFKEIAERRYRDYRQLSQGIASSSFSLIATPEGDATPVRSAVEIESGVRSQLLDTLCDRSSPLVVLTGGSGIGKSHLLQTLEPELNKLFSKIIRHSFYESPSWLTWHQKLAPPDNDITSSPNLEQSRQQVIQTLNQHPCLILIEQGERFLDDPDYQTFLREITTTVSTKSCVLWITAVQPTNLDQQIPIETVTGLSFADTKALLIKFYPYLESSLAQQAAAWEKLHALCGGNPSLIHKSVETLKSFYANQIEQFITNLLPLSPSITSYFEQIFAAHSETEQELLYWLVFRPLSWTQIREWPLILPFTQPQLMQAWGKLHRRHFLEFYSEKEGLCQLNTGYFRLYLLEKLQTIFLQELTSEELTLFHRYPFIIPNAPTDSQRELKQYLLEPVANALQQTHLANALGEKINRLLRQLIIFPKQPQSCAAGNLLNLANHLNLKLPEDIWAGLTLWHVNLSSPQLQPYTFRDCQLNNTALMTGLQGTTVSALHPQGNVVAIGDEQGWLQVYQQTQQRFTLEWCQDLGVPINDIAITQDNRLVVTLGDQTLHIWDNLTVNEQAYDNLSSEAAICSTSLRADSNLIAAGVSSGQVYLWDLMWEDTAGTPLPELTNIVRHLAFSPDGKVLAGHDHNNLIRIWHRNLRADSYTAQKATLPLNPYGHFLAFGWNDVELQVVEAVVNDDYQTSNPEVVVRSFTPIEQTSPEDSMAPHIEQLEVACQPHKAAFSENGLYLALCDVDHRVDIWHHRLPVSEKSVVLPTLPYALSISNDGQWLLCQNTHTVSLWDLEHQQCLRVWETVSDLDQYRGYIFYHNQGFSNDELLSIQRLGGTIK